MDTVDQGNPENLNDDMTVEQVVRTLLDASDKRVCVVIEYECQTHAGHEPRVQRLLAPTSFKQVGRAQRWGLYSYELVRGRLLSNAPIKLFLLDGIRKVTLTEQKYDRDALVNRNIINSRSAA